MDKILKTLEELNENICIGEQHSKEEIERIRKENYGQEAIFDFHNVPMNDYSIGYLKLFAKNLAKEIGMRCGPAYYWGTKGELNSEPELPVKADGISVVQFIYESSITIHALDTIQKLYINIFSCKQFDFDKAKKFILEHIKADLVCEHNIIRH